MQNWIRPIGPGILAAALVACSVAPSALPLQHPFGVVAHDFATEARQAGRVYAHEATAQQAGFVAINPNKDQGVVLYRNPAAITDDKVAVAANPEGLFYGHAQGESVLLGVVYLAPRGQGPEIPAATWTRLDTLVANQRMVPVGVPEAVSALLTSYDAMVVWMFDHPAGQYSTTIDRTALEAALRYSTTAVRGVAPTGTESPNISNPVVSGTPQANPVVVQNRRSTVGTVVSISRTTIVVNTGSGSRQFSIGQRASVSFWGTPAISGSLADVQVGDRVSVGTISAQRPDVATTIVVLSKK